jgi:uncharacterized protein YdhG (YjbR/CyaY superfamily)
MSRSRKTTAATRPAAARRKNATRAEPAAAQIRAYLSAQPPATRRALRQIRAEIRRAVPGAVEVFSYGIPGFRFDGRSLIWYAGWARYCSLYPLTAGMRASNAAVLARYSSGKGTARLPLDEPLPLPLIRKLVRARAAEIRQRGK